MAKSSADQSARCSLRRQFVAIASSAFSTVLPQAISVTSEPAWRLRAFPSGTARIGSALSRSAQNMCFGIKNRTGSSQCIAVHNRPAASSGVAGNDDRKPRVMRERCFVRLAMPQTSARQIRAIRRINHHRTFPLAERTPAQTADVGHQLVPTGPDEVDELQFENGTLAVRSQGRRRHQEWSIPPAAN